MIPTLYLRLGLAGAALAAVLTLWSVWDHRGHELAQARALAAQQGAAIKQLRANAALQAQQAKISDKAEAKQIEVQHQIQVQTRTIIEKVPVYVDAQTDAQCFVPVGLVRLYNAAAIGADPATVSDPAGRPDGAASGIACSALASDLIDNFSIARGNAEQLSGLIEWNREIPAAQ